MYLYIGKIVNTHGIKGELRILSNFKYKDKIFKENFDFYIGDNKIKETVKSYRHHKQFEMVMFLGYENINEVLMYKTQKLYILKEDLVLREDEFLDQKLLGMSVFQNNSKLGIVKNVFSNNATLVLELDTNIMIPLIAESFSIIEEKITLNKGVNYVEN